MADSSIAVTEGSGKNLRTFAETVGGTLVQSQFVIVRDSPGATYVVAAATVSTATANAHILAVQAGSSKTIEVRKIVVSQDANATTATPIFLELRRLTSAGSGGTALSVPWIDPADPAASLTAQTLPSSKGTEGDLITRRRLHMQASASSASGGDVWTWETPPNCKPLVISAGTTNGLCLKNTTACAGGSLNVLVYCTEE